MNNTPSHRTYNIAASLCAVMAALLGGVVIIGWHLDIRGLTQISPEFAPMQYNTALCFMLSGVALFMRARGFIFLSGILGAAVLLLSGITLLQYILSHDYGVDLFFMDSAIMVNTSHPGRMAPNTALCFILVGAIFVIGRKHISTRIGFAATVVFLAVTALLGYCIGVDDIYGWGNLTRMALHTALGMLVLGTGLLCIILQRRKSHIDIWSFLPVSFSAVIAIIAFFAWYVAAEAAKARNSAYFDSLVMVVQDALKDRFVLYEHGIRAGLGLFYASDVVEREEWISFVETLDVRTHFPGISGIGYIDYVHARDLDRYIEWVRNDDVPDFKVYPETFYPDKFVIRLIEPLEDNGAALGLDIGFEPHRRAAAERARDLGVSALTKKIELVQDSEKRAGFLLLLPVYQDGVIPETIEEKRKHFKGWAYAPFIGKNYLEGLTAVTRDQVDFEVFDGEKINQDTVIYKGSAVDAQQNAQYTKTTQIRIAGRKWTIVWHTTNLFDPPENNNIALVFLGFGLLFSLFVYLILSQLLKRKEIIASEVREQTAVIKTNAAQREKLVDQLVRSNEDLERFAYIASHDLQEPLRMVRSFTGLLEEQYSDKLDETAQKYIGFAYSSAGRMQDLINDLLDYSRIGSDAERRENIHLDDVLEDVLENLQEKIERTGAEITRDNLPEITGNPVRITRLLQNLIGNALKYQQEGKAPKIHVSSKEEDNVWLISVADNGIGIDRKYAHKIFEPFERLHGKGQYSGTGMGLAICKRIVEDFDGDIWVETDKSKVQQGSIFYFTIPKK